MICSSKVERIEVALYKMATLQDLVCLVTFHLR